ncbi:MAG: hypothetical protein IK018_12110 [Lachnospiraceae bacterium]|nr:hypothetical protein [Lachnospiraceae bacterium]
MRRVLVVTLGSLSSGEFTIANEFCNKLPSDKFEVYFLTSQKGASYISRENYKYCILEMPDSNLMLEIKQKNKTKAQEVLSEFKPDFVLISDVYTMWYSVSWSGVDLEMLKSTGAIVGSIDSYQFHDTTYIQDYYGGYVAKLPPLIEECDFVVRYCPINKYVENSKIKCTYLFEAEEISEKEESEFKKEYNVKDGEKVVFITTSNWESLNINRLPALTNLLKWIPRIIVECLKELNVSIKLIHVGTQALDVSFDDTSIVYCHHDFIDPKKFDVCLKCSDLFITTNIISTTLAKAVYYNTASVVLQNSKYLDFSKMASALQKMPEWYQKMAAEVKTAFPYRLFPFGWYEFLKPLFYNNPYTDTFTEVNLFKKNQIVKALRDNLCNEEKIKEIKEKQKKYIEDIMKLPSPSDVLESLEQDKAIEKFLSKPCKINEQFTAGYKKKYRITMKNLYLNKEGNTYKIQHLNSKYIREIKDIIPGIIVLTNYRWDSVTYIERYPKKKPNSMEWNFVKGKDFSSHILLSDDFEYEEGDDNVFYATYKGSFRSITEAYNDLPALPSTYLVIMQTFDIVCFENFVSYLYIQSHSHGGFKIDEWVKIKPSELEHEAGAEIGMGKYATGSSFVNNILNIRYLGYSFCLGRVCLLFEYYCDAAKVYMEDKAGKNERKGTSYYQGFLYIDRESGDLLRATQEENYTASQTGTENKSINIKRRILCEMMDEELNGDDNNVL